ncbi:sphingomyelin phosphodiesterase [Leptospira mayottensis]|uniref:sphingomyelin phosphodiesterase n=1 Tax=Leptospira mayottensis TaxID=1137606 RepID=UPI00056C001E|nr:sphingomyelin phosphodiesterase [Leptospira mayottensis]AZQ00964.1 sphingomyelin phosphodiesterase [Leptospira mayottensis 200901116]
MRIKKYTKVGLFINCCLLLFFLIDCGADRRSLYNDLLVSLIYILGNKNIDSANSDLTSSGSVSSNPVDAASANSIPENSISENSIPANSIPENSISENSIPANSIPENSISENSIPENSIPENSILEDSISENSIPENSIPENSIPENSILENVEIKILSHNVFLLPKALPGWGSWGQSTRAERIVSSSYIRNQDVIVFDEAFDTNARKVLLDGVRSEYPYQTDVIGRTREGWDVTSGNYRIDAFINGGVVVVSKWPIEEKIQHIFKDKGCGADIFSNKGFAYVRINKKGRKFHIIGTHVQAQDSGCANLGKVSRINQFKEIKNFIDLKKIPQNEMVLIAGDLNVVKDSVEYYDMLSVLNANEPKYVGVPFTWDTKTNEITAFYYKEEEPVYLDYVLVSKSHFQPPVWQNLAYDPISAKTWTIDGYTSDEFSDHYPVYGFVYADSSTPTKSGRKRKYDRVSFVSAATGRRIQAGSEESNAWLKVDATAETDFTKFNLVQISNPDSNPSCMTSGFVRIEPSQSLNYFWNWGLGGGGGNYAYYPKFNDGSNRIQILNLDGGCLRDGSRIAFKDYDTVSRRQYFLTVWEGGNWDKYLYLWRSWIGLREIFYLKLDSSPEKDWSSDLIYR